MGYGSGRIDVILRYEASIGQSVFKTRLTWRNKFNLASKFKGLKVRQTVAQGKANLRAMLWVNRPQIFQAL